MLLPLHNPPPWSHFWECPAARATWGDVCSLARRISNSMKAGACMKPDLGEWVLSDPLFPSSSYEQEYTGIHGNQLIFAEILHPCNP